MWLDYHTELTDRYDCLNNCYSLYNQIVPALSVKAFTLAFLQPANFKMNTTFQDNMTETSHWATFSASRLLLISAPSILVCRSELDVSAPRSLPVTAVAFLCVG